VGFRYFTVRTARALGVRGWVRNRRDGTVEVQAAASPELLERFREELEEGPPAGRVVRVREEEVRGEVGEGFEVRY
jgi:acylphosphatase